MLDFLHKQRISVLTTLLKSGMPHSAVLHYATNKDATTYYFLTDISSRKMDSLVNADRHLASLVVGFSEEDWLTFQAEGYVRWLSEKTGLEVAWECYVGKFQDAAKHRNSPDNAILEFVPKWWRFTKVKPSPPLVITG